MKRMLTIWAVGMAVMAAAGQPPEQGEDRSEWRIQNHVRRLFRAMGSLSDWDTHSAYITDALEKTYERNGWTSEPDRFAMEMMRQVNQVPPWRPDERFDIAARLMAERYALDDEQQRIMRDTMIQESNDLFVRHSGRIMQYAVEAIQTRAAGEPFTPEQVARWARLAEPVFLDSRERINAAAQEFASYLRPEQAEALLNDVEAANRRMDDLYVQSQRWAEGDWDPLDWGLEEDPIQTGAGLVPSLADEGGAAGRPERGGRQPAEPEAVEADRGPVPATSQPGGEDAWAGYVRRFIAKYKLNAAQQERAWRIYRDVTARANAQRGRYGQHIEAAAKRAAARKDEKSQSGVTELQKRLDSQLNQLYMQLKARLDRLPTRQQRAEAEPTELEPSRSVPAPVDPMPHDGP
ncbi:MAG: hypothetical protein KBH81_12845 [Phycisphaerae bacterium]|jgi:hypothetical protein|nr:hypothetical protein [Phycisphaerae bacterium]HOO17747.1 hypothetical protein [Phycisphaerae bacterium]HPC23320.1 hypothetical protein [Phycisphaerae bacterium]HRS28896.1 hypothetical protein [Phycisphaerae bacterium]HRT42673.1 hypothetical protein [Phycisphaerae bacterium]